MTDLDLSGRDEEYEAAENHEPSAGPGRSERAARLAASLATAPNGRDPLSMAVPDSLLPAQYFGALRRRPRGEATRRLGAAVLERGIDDYLRFARSPHPADARIGREVEAWIESRDTQDLFAFENLCRELDLEPDALRRGLRDLLDHGKVGPSQNAYDSSPP